MELNGRKLFDVSVEIINRLREVRSELQKAEDVALSLAGDTAHSAFLYRHFQMIDVAVYKAMNAILEDGVEGVVGKKVFIVPPKSFLSSINEDLTPEEIDQLA